MKRIAWVCLLSALTAVFGLSVSAATDPIKCQEVAQAASALPFESLFGKNLEKADFPEGVWSVNDAGELTANSDQVIWTKEKYGSFVCEFEFKLSPKTNGGFVIQCLNKEDWIPNAIEIQLLDDAGQEPTYHSCGSIYGFQAPTKNVTKAPGEWNKMRVSCVGRVITVWLNGEKINQIDTSEWTDNAKSPSGTDIEEKFHGHSLASVEAYGYIGFQGLHGNAPMVIKNAKIQVYRYAPDTTSYEWSDLFGKDLAKADYDPAIWSIDGDGVMKATKDNVIWTKEKFMNFVLDLEFMNSEKANSGVVIKATDKENWIPNALEVQVFDSFGATTLDYETCGAIYGRCPVMLNVCKEPGQWNRMTVVCATNWIFVFINGEMTSVMNMSDYKEKDKNIDGSDVKPWLINLPPCEMKNLGYIGLQGLHGESPVVYRNVKIMRF